MVYRRGRRGSEGVRSWEFGVLLPKYSKGFTLLEVMIAVVIMAMVLVSLFTLGNRSVQDVAVAEHITTATLLAKRIMADLITSKPVFPLEDEGEFTDEPAYAGYAWKKSVAPTPLIRIMELRVSVLWKEGSRQESVDLVSYE